MHAPDAIDLNAFVTTPENIRFEYRIAGPFRRFPSLLIDFALRIAFFWFMLILLGMIGVVIRFSSGIVLLLVLVSWFVLDWFYGLIFEAFWNGQTPGKWLTRIRVISVDGRPINAYQATIRNFLRLADFAPMVSLEIFSPDAPPMYKIPTFLVSLLCMALTKRFQRLGDLAAGTMVVVNQKTWAPPNIKFEDARVESLSGHIPANFRMSITLARAISLYVERRSRIPNARRLELANYLAKPLLKKFEFREDTSPDLLLCALYYREFIAKDAFSETAAYMAPPSTMPSSNAVAPFTQSKETASGTTSPKAVPPLLNPTPSVEADSGSPSQVSP